MKHAHKVISYEFHFKELKTFILHNKVNFLISLINSSRCKVIIVSV